MDRGAWRDTVHGVNQTRLKWPSMHILTSTLAMTLFPNTVTFLGLGIPLTKKKLFTSLFFCIRSQFQHMGFFTVAHRLSSCGAWA